MHYLRYSSLAVKSFYDLFEQVADNLKLQSEAFVENIGLEQRSARKNSLDKIERLEHKNDEATHKLFVELGRNYITPFDREDIHQMATALDDVADYIWATAKQMYYFDIDVKVSATKEIAECIVSFVNKLSEAMRGLRNRRDLSAMIAILADMRKITSQTDDAINKSRTEVFEENTDPIEVIKLSDHYNMLQNLSNKCGDVTNVLEAMIIKYS